MLNIIQIYLRKHVQFYKSAICPLILNVVGALILLLITLVFKYSGLKETPTTATTFFLQTKVCYEKY